MAIFKPSSRKKANRTPVSSEPIDLVIDSFSHDGRGIARSKGKAVFIEGGLPGEKIKARITKQSRKYDEGFTLTVLENASEQRVVPPCPVFTRCGGCSLQHMNASIQLHNKQQSVLSQLQRWSKLQPATIATPITADDYGYRQRMRLSVKYTRNGELQMGFREANSQRLVDIQSCMVLKLELQVLIPLIRQWLVGLKPNIVSHIECLYTQEGCGVVVRHVRTLAPEQRKQLVELVEQSGCPTNCWFQSEKASILENEDGVIVDPRLSYCLNASSNTPSLQLLFHPQDFIQSNAKINQQMVIQALAWMTPQTDECVVDLFCGIGNFSLVLAQHAGYIIGVEGVDAMVRRAQENASNNAIKNAGFIAQDLFLEKGDIWQHIKANAADRGYASVAGVLLDPPRAGAKIICEKISELMPKRIVYVSCDSSTFARDAGILANNGYSLSKMGLMDMFPQTTHSEIMGLFELTP